MNLDIEKVIREYINKTVHMSLGTSSGNKPWVCEVHFVYDEDLNLYFCSVPETRHCTELTQNPSVAGNIVKQHDITESPNGIYFEGNAALVESPTEKDIERYCSRLGRNVEELTAMLGPDGGRCMYKIEVKNWAAFGKFDGVKNAKYELAWNGGKK
jgi:uncharacterized protein YhbP (UPF0306 family)